MKEAGLLFPDELLSSAGQQISYDFLVSWTFHEHELSESNFNIFLIQPAFAKWREIYYQVSFH